jgi:hypothetical protein
MDLFPFSDGTGGQTRLNNERESELIGRKATANHEVIEKESFHRISMNSVRPNQEIPSKSMGFLNLMEK